MKFTLLDTEPQSSPFPTPSTEQWSRTLTCPSRSIPNTKRTHPQKQRSHPFTLLLNNMKSPCSWPHHHFILCFSTTTLPTNSTIKRSKYQSPNSKLRVSSSTIKWLIRLSLKEIISEIKLPILIIVRKILSTTRTLQDQKT